MFKNAYRLAIILPTKDSSGELLSIETRRYIQETVQTDFSLFAGGFTQYDSAGGWMDNGAVMCEDSLTVYTDCQDISIEEVLKHGATIGRIVANLASQTCVSVSVQPVFVAYVEKGE